jgi:glycosyltransferase involved in cell wall biosynthesis
MKPTVSVVLAAHDEAGVIGRVIDGCKASTPGLLEVVVVDDGSTDGTEKVAARAGARVVRLAENQGKGTAIRRGIAEAQGELLVFLDADGQDDPADIPLLLDAIEAGADMVVGSRFLGVFHGGAITPINRLGNRALTQVVNALFGTKLTDTQAGFRAVRRTFAERCHLSARRYDIEVDLLLGVLRHGGRVAEVPVKRMARAYGTSDLGSVRDGTRILARILWKRLTLRP